MGRLNTMTNLATSAQIITGTAYDAASRIVLISGNLGESRTYNVMGQMTQLTTLWTSGLGLNISYNYSATKNNGKITSQTDNLSGEQAVYNFMTP